MWGRWCEIVLGLWLLLSSQIFSTTGLWAASSTASGVVVIVLALASFARKLRKAHLAELAVAGWLVIHGWLATRGVESPPPPAQNEIVVGLLVATFAIVPSEALQPPMPWRGAGERSDSR